LSQQKSEEMCIGLNSEKLPNDMVTGVTIVTTQLVRNATIEKTQLVTNSTLKMTQGEHYVSCLHDMACIGTELIEQHDHTWHIAITKQLTKLHSSSLYPSIMIYFPL